MTMNDELPENWSYNPGREELVCPHGVGHYLPWASRSVHGCDGCCGGDEWGHAVETLKEQKRGDS